MPQRHTKLNLAQFKQGSLPWAANSSVFFLRHLIFEFGWRTNAPTDESSLNKTCPDISSRDKSSHGQTLTWTLPPRRVVSVRLFVFVPFFCIHIRPTSFSACHFELSWNPKTGPLVANAAAKAKGPFIAWDCMLFSMNNHQLYTPQIKNKRKTWELLSGIQLWRELMSGVVILESLCPLQLLTRRAFVFCPYTNNFQNQTITMLENIGHTTELTARHYYQGHMSDPVSDEGKTIPTFLSWRIVQNFSKSTPSSLANLEGQFQAQGKLEGGEFRF